MTEVTHLDITEKHNYKYSDNIDVGPDSKKIAKSCLYEFQEHYLSIY